MKSKYLIGLIPSLFILMIACFARAAPVQLTSVIDISTSCYERVSLAKSSELFIK